MFVLVMLIACAQWRRRPHKPAIERQANVSTALPLPAAGINCNPGTPVPRSFSGTPVRVVTPSQVALSRPRLPATCLTPSRIHPELPSPSSARNTRATTPLATPKSFTPQRLAPARIEPMRRATAQDTSQFACSAPPQAVPQLNTPQRLAPARAERVRRAIAQDAPLFGHTTAFHSSDFARQLARSSSGASVGSAATAQCRHMPLASTPLSRPQRLRDAPVLSRMPKPGHGRRSAVINIEPAPIPQPLGSTLWSRRQT